MAHTEDTQNKETINAFGQQVYRIKWFVRAVVFANVSIFLFFMPRVGVSV